MSSIKVVAKTKNISGKIKLSGSKSISNRVLLIQALTKDSFEIENLSDSDDTQTLQALLQSHDSTLDAHHAGTTFRFLTAYLSMKGGTQILTGSERMKQRPIKALVDALNQLGANITYLENEGYPPLSIQSPKEDWKNEIELPADISSQYITALLLIAPVLENGLTIRLIGNIVSRPYIEMTLDIMAHFGVKTEWVDHEIKVAPQSYQAQKYHVESDWSAASYFYSIAALSDTTDLVLEGLHQNSLQGDAEIVKIGEKFGIKTTFGDHQLTITKRAENKAPEFFEYDFLKVPDIAQSISVMCAGLGTQVLYSGLQTLKIKETDRIAALQTELLKVQVYLSKLPAKFSKKTDTEYYMQEGKALFGEEDVPAIDTYNDHRMAMSFAPLALIDCIHIHNPDVVSKSYPDFWKDLTSIGFEISDIS
jgi:3-phosphoshikimate 1-carboxyvinyltransferase